jgi:integrase
MPIKEYIKAGKTHYKFAFEVLDEHGNRKTIKKAGFTTKGEARDAEADARVKWNKGTHINKSTLLFGEFIQEWLDNKQNLSEQARYTNQGHLKNHITPLLGSIPLQKINYTHIEELVSELQKKGLADGTVKKVYNLMQTCIKSALKKELIIKNPFDYLDDSSKPRAGKAKIDYWTKDEVKHFLNNLNSRYKILFEIAVYTGMRRGEILGLRFRDVDFDSRQIRIVQTLGFGEKVKMGAKTDAGNRSISAPLFLINRIQEHRAMIDN